MILSCGDGDGDVDVNGCVFLALHLHFLSSFLLFPFLLLWH
jgi:hypothetical protein